MGSRIFRNKGTNEANFPGQGKGIFAHSVFAPLLNHHRKLKMIVHRRSLWCSVIFTILGLITIIASTTITVLIVKNVIAHPNNDGVVGSVIVCGIGCVFLTIGIIYGVVTFKKSKVKNPDTSPESRAEQLLVSGNDMDCKEVTESMFLEPISPDSNLFLHIDTVAEKPIEILVLDPNNLHSQPV